MRCAHLLGLTLLLPLPAQSPTAPRPDIVVILADDLGWSDLGCYGGEIRTPHLDGLAVGGVRFTQFYNTARCCPTRASLLTGQYPHLAGVGHMMDDRGHDGYRGVLSRRCVTIAEVLGANGYRTGMVGKWHVTRHVDPDGPKDSWPLQRGFQSFWGTIHGAGSYFAPVTLTDGNDPAPPVADGFYYTDALGERAAGFIAAQPADRPLFLYVAFTAPHWPLQARPEDIAAERGRYDDGWDAVRQRRLDKQRALGLLDPAWNLSPRDPRAPDWDKAPHREWQARRMEVYAAQVTAMDRAVGRIVAALAAADRLDRTLLLFLADNGGCAEELGRGRSRSVPTHTRDGRTVRNGNDPAVMPGPEDTYQSYGLAWANASNTPFRLYKHYVHEGGIASPLIAHWPQGIAARGELCHQPGHVIDLLATCLDVSGAHYPLQADGHQVPPPAGTSLWPAMRGEELPGRALFFEHEGNRAVRAGRHKLVARGKTGPWELYDLAADRSETRDLAAAHPELVAELAAAWQDWAERNQVLPLDPQQSAAAGSPATRFELRHGDGLPRERSPQVAGAGFKLRLSAQIDGDGVLVAQGGSTHGWSLARRDGRLVFSLRRAGVLTAVAGAVLPLGEVTLTGTLGADGAVAFASDGREVLNGRVPGLLAAMPGEGLQVGRDTGSAVGGYDAPFALQGEVRELVLELNR